MFDIRQFLQGLLGNLQQGALTRAEMPNVGSPGVQDPFLPWAQQREAQQMFSTADVSSPQRFSLERGYGQEKQGLMPSFDTQTSPITRDMISGMRTKEGGYFNRFPQGPVKQGMFRL